MYKEDETLKKLNSLLKASEEAEEGGDGDKDGDGDEGYNESYMKKHMKRFMKENGSFMKKHMKGELTKAAKDLGIGDVIIPDQIELDQADSVMIDGTEFFKATQERLDEQATLIKSLCSAVDGLLAGYAGQAELNKASAQVLVKAYEGINAIGGNPNPLRSSVQGTGQVPGSESEGSEKVLAKAQEVGVSGVRSLLRKAMESGDSVAGDVLVQLDTARTVERLNKTGRDKVAELLLVS